MRLIPSCPICNKKSIEVSHTKINNTRFITLNCGHTYSEKGLEVSNLSTIILADGRELYPFQNNGVKFIEASNFRCLISDEMGLGKTIQAIGAINLHYKELVPILIIVKASLTFNWLREVVKGSGKLAQIFESGDKLIPGIDIVIVSYDTLTPRKSRNGNKENNSNFETLKSFSPRTIILDEVQAIKNHDAKRTQAIRELARGLNNPRIIALSGTPIKNNALEYFPILNLLRPEMFPSRTHFENTWIDYYWTGSTYKPGGIKYYKDFLHRTKDFIIRRTREEVLPDLPKITRDYKYYKMGDIVRKEYSKKVRSLEKFLSENECVQKVNFAVDLISYLSILRHITGLAKIDPILEYIQEYIENGGMKLVIFHHHIDVGDVLVSRLNDLKIKNIRIIAADDSETRLDKIDQFKNESEVPIILIAPTLACGEGINLQFCSNAILLEREWNPANEEQVEGRFSRIGSQANTIDVCYPIAIETIDEFFTEIVERKRAINTQTLDGIESNWDQSTIMLELANLVVKKWSY